MKDYPAPEPVRFAVMLQSWCDLTFLHWRMPVDVVARRVPRPLTVESFDGSAWIGVTPFLLKDLRPPGIPSLPWISSFPETNCRTYVRAPDGRSGVWFFSLDAARAVAVAGARIGYGLPYAWAKMRVRKTGARLAYESSRRWPDTNARTAIEIERGDPLRSSELEIFLTVRFHLFSFILGRLMYARVDHPPWPLERAKVIRAEQTLIECAGFPKPEGAPIAHFSPGVAVRVGAPRRVR